MNNKLTTRIVRMSLVGVSLLVIGLLVYQQRSGAEAAAATRVEQAWNNIRPVSYTHLTLPQSNLV